MIIQWLTFAIMILIQAVAAGVIISAMRTTLTTYGEEIRALRDWRHSFGPKEMVITDHGEQLKDHETRIRDVEKRRLGLCPLEDCPLRKVEE
jgi:hypothetical protein